MNFFEVPCVDNYNHFHHRVFYHKQNLNFHITKTTVSSPLNILVSTPIPKSPDTNLTVNQYGITILSTSVSVTSQSLSSQMFILRTFLTSTQTDLIFNLGSYLLLQYQFRFLSWVLDPLMMYLVPCLSSPHLTFYILK